MTELALTIILLCSLVGSFAVIAWLVVRLVHDWREGKRRWTDIRRRNAPTYHDLYLHDDHAPRPNVRKIQ